MTGKYLPTLLIRRQTGTCRVFVYLVVADVVHHLQLVLACYYCRLRICSASTDTPTPLLTVIVRYVIQVKRTAKVKFLQSHGC